MALSHIKVQNVFVLKRYVRQFMFKENQFTVIFIGGRKAHFTLDYAPTKSEIAWYEAELEDR